MKLESNSMCRPTYKSPALQATIKPRSSPTAPTPSHTRQTDPPAGARMRYHKASVH